MSISFSNGCIAPATGCIEVDADKPIDNSRYDYSQSNPLGSENPCDLIKPRGTVKTRGITAYDLLKPNPKLKVKRTQKEIQECCRPSFDHPKILHILIDRAKGFGCKTLAKRHGGSFTQISKFCRSMGFGQIDMKDRLFSNGEPARKSAQQIYEAEWMREIHSTKKDRTWARHPAVQNWQTMKKYHANPKLYLERCKSYRKNNGDKVAEYDRKWREANKEKLAEWVRKYREENPEKMREYRKTSRKKPINKIRHNIRRRLREYVKLTGANWGGFGCTSNKLREHLERQFTKRMTWENYGTYWHVDHIRPLASFDLFNQDQRRAANHYTNLQPLEAKKNQAKSDDWDGQLDMAAQLL